MGSGVSHLAGCFIRPRDGSSDGGVGLQYSEPLDEGLGHSFCYVRPPPLGSPPLISPDKSDEIPNPNGKHLPVPVSDDETLVDGADLSSSQKEEAATSHAEKSRSAVERIKSSSSDRPKNPHIDKTKNVSETSFKSISGASVSANTATPRSIISCEQFNSFANVLYDRAAAFESTSSFSALPLQPVPRGFSGPLCGASGPLSGPLDRGFMSGPIERGFMSGPLERGFMSGPLERGYMSGPLEPGDRSHFSAPLNGPYNYSTGYLRKRKKSLVRFVRSMSGPMKKALAKTASSLARTQRSIVAPVKSYVFRENRDNKESKEKDSGDKESSKAPQKSVDEPENVDYTSSELDLRESDNLQWAQGKAGEDRVHVVLSEEHGWLFVGIYDGFNGPDAPDFLMSNLYTAVYQELKGLLWDTKEDSTSQGDEESEWEVVGERQADGGETVTSEDFSTRRKERGQREGGRKRGMGVVVDQNRRWNRRGLARSSEKVHSLKGERAEGDTVNLYVDDRTIEVDDVACVNETKSGFCKSGSDWEDSKMEDAGFGEGEVIPVECESEEASTIHNSGQAGSSQERSSLEREGKLAEDRGNANEDESSGELALEQAESMTVSSSSVKEQRLIKKRSVTGFKVRNSHERRKEQLRKYFQWRYDWDHENAGFVQKVKNAKVSQEPEISSKNKAVDHTSVLKALARALQSTEDAYLDMADNVLYENPELALMGSCVLVMLMKDEDVYILNVGDSRAILAQHPKVEPVNMLGKLGRSGLHRNDSGARDSLLRIELERIIEETPLELEALEAAHDNCSMEGPPICGPSLLGALQLTTDHSTSIVEEVLRIKAEHSDADTIHNHRVKGRLKVTRAFGAGFLKQPKWNNALLEMFRVDFIGTAPYITCAPALYHHRLGPLDQFLVLSSDGLYQYLSNEEVVSHVEWFMEKFPDGDPAQHLIEELLFRAAKKAGMDFHELLDIPQGDRRKYHDDVSVMVISLEGRIWRSSGPQNQLELLKDQESQLEVRSAQFYQPVSRRRNAWAAGAR